MSNKDIHNEEKAIRKVIAESKLKASENLKFRIINQIETEEALKPKQVPGSNSIKKDSSNILKDFGYLFGTMYIIIAIITLFFYITEGRESLFTVQYLGLVILAASIFSIFWMFTRLDIYTRRKFSKKTNRKDSSTDQNAEPNR